jgi:hypothetical protein
MKKLNDLTSKILAKFKFKRFKIEFKGRRFKLFGEVNPWVLLAEGKIKKVDDLGGQNGKIVKYNGQNAVVLDDVTELSKLSKKQRKDVYKDALKNNSEVEIKGSTGASGATNKKSLPDWLKERFNKGNEFNKQNRPRYTYNEVEVTVDGKKTFVADSYIPGKEIVSRKFTQLAGIQEKTAIGYLDEFTIKYSSGTKITNGSFNSNALKGGELKGDLIFEVPVQNKQIPQKVLDEATKRNIIIRDIEGRIYN